MRKHWKGAAAVFAALAVALFAIGCSTADTTSTPAASDATATGKVVIGSKIDTEGELLSSIIKVKLADAGFDVVDKSQTGTTDVVRKALLAGEIDIYPEYTGSGLIFFEGSPESTASVYKDPQQGYDTVKKLDKAANNVVWLAPAKANNTWLIALKKQFAEQNGLKTMSDFTDYIKAGKNVKIAGSDEFFVNPDAAPAFESTYGFKFGDAQKVTFAGGNTSQTEKAVADGTDGVNFGMAYGTDGALADLGLVVLEDDKGAQLVYWPTPIVRGDILAKYPSIAELLDPVFQSLDISKLQELNARIQVNGEDPDAVATDYLQTNGFIAK